MSNEVRAGAGVENQPVGSAVDDKGAAERGNLIVVSAPSGAGKSSLVERALRGVRRLKYSISYTTRAPRGSEKEGVDYYFVPQERFDEMRGRGEFIESAEVHGFWYGTHRAAVDGMLDEGFDVILDIDVQGARQVLRHMPEAVTVFVMPPSRKVLEARLRKRNLNAPEDLERRLRNASAEVRHYEEFDYLIVNDDRDVSFASLKAIIFAERRRPARQRRRARSILDTFGGLPTNG